jgi:hypothetical protein
MALLEQWFPLFHSMLLDINISLKHIWNTDEIGFQVGVPGRQHVVIPWSDKNWYVQQPEKKSWASVLETTNRRGKALPPFFRFDGTCHQLRWYPRNSPKGCKFTISENGWTTNDIAVRWLKEHSEPLTRPACTPTKLLPLLDGHDSHKTWEFLKFCRNHHIVVLCLPPHITHKLQPLDVSCFQPLKYCCQEALDTDGYLDYTAIKKFHFIQLYKRVHQLALVEKHIARAWKETGLIPYDPSKV